MSTINKTILTTILVLLIVAATWLLAGEAYAAERAMWVWGMADDIILDQPAGAGAEFFSFCDAPHEDSSKKITVVYLSGHVPGKNLISSSETDLRVILDEIENNILLMKKLR